MKAFFSALALVALVILLPLHAAAEPKKDRKNPLPGKATWDLRALERAFKVLDTIYDTDQKQVTWALETKEAVRTADFQRELDREKPFVFRFLDADMEELATVRLGSTQFKGVPNERIMQKGTRLEAVLDVPNVLEKTVKVTVQRGGN